MPDSHLVGTPSTSPFRILPNLLTLLRLALAPFIIGAILQGRHSAALLLFACAAVTDGIDGVLARRFGWTTTAGAYLDPITDKVLLSGIYLALAAVESVPWWFVGVIFGRDLLILVSAGMALFLTRLRQFPPSVWGKASTFLQILTAVAWMGQNVWPSLILEAFATIMVWPTLAATIWSGIHYGWRALRLARTH